MATKKKSRVLNSRLSKDRKTLSFDIKIPLPRQRTRTSDNDLDSMRIAMAKAVKLKPSQLPGHEASVYVVCAEVMVLRKDLQTARAEISRLRAEKNDDHLIAYWEGRIHSRARSVDPQNEHDWLDLAVGFFLGHGRTPKQAKALASRLSSMNLL